MLNINYYGHRLSIKVIQLALQECWLMQDKDFSVEKNKLFVSASKRRSYDLFLELAGNLDSNT